MGASQLVRRRGEGGREHLYQICSRVAAPRAFGGISGVSLTLMLALLCAISSGCDDDESSSTPGADQASVNEEQGVTGDGGVGEQGTPLEPDMGSSVDDRCPDARAGEHILVLYADRVEAYRRDTRGFKANYVCEIIALREQGVEAAVRMVLGSNQDIYVAQEEEGGGAVYRYNRSGEFVSKGEVNINLTGIAGIWRGEGSELIAWSAGSENFYRIDEDGGFVGRWTPPNAADSRVSAVIDLQMIDPDMDGNPRALMAFSDRPPQVFAFPNNPSFPEDEIASARAITPVETEIITTPMTMVKICDMPTAAMASGPKSPTR